MSKNQARLLLLDTSESIHILEIGAASACTRAIVLKALQPYAASLRYTYSHKSSFLKHERKTFGDAYPFVEFKILNIEHDGEAHGYQVGKYDLVMCAHVLHAISHIGNTLSQVKFLMKRNGLLLLNKVTQVRHFRTLTFGLLKGRWLFQDPENRYDGSPLFSKMSCFIDPNHGTAIDDQRQHTRTKPSKTNDAKSAKSLSQPHKNRPYRSFITLVRLNLKPYFDVSPRRRTLFV